MPQCRVFGLLGGCCPRWGLPSAEPRTVTALEPCDTLPLGLGTGAAAAPVPSIPAVPSTAFPDVPSTALAAMKASPVSLLQVTPPAQSSALPSGSLTSPYYSDRVSLNYREKMSAGALLIFFRILCSTKGSAAILNRL